MGKMGLILILLILLSIIGTGGYLLLQNYNKTTNNGGGNIQLTRDSTQNNVNFNTNPTAKEDIPSAHKINIENFAYTPKTITIKKGYTIIWTNEDDVKHTVTSDSGGELGSKLLSKTESYSHTFLEAGVYEYHCIPHSYMKAKVVVE